MEYDRMTDAVGQLTANQHRLEPAEGRGYECQKCGEWYFSRYDVPPECDA